MVTIPLADGVRVRFNCCHVFVASANDNEFSLCRSVREGREPEEQCLSYGAILGEPLEQAPVQPAGRAQP